MLLLIMALSYFKEALIQEARTPGQPQETTTLILKHKAKLQERHETYFLIHGSQLQGHYPRETATAASLRSKLSDP